MSIEDELLADAKAPAPPGAEALGLVGKLANELVDLDRQIEDAEEAVKALRKRREIVAAMELPEAMTSIGLSMTKTTDGHKIEIVQVLSGSIPARNRDEAMAWLRESGNGSLIKIKLAAEFGRGEEEKARDVAKTLSDVAAKVEVSEAVHPQTLGKWAREMLEQGKEVPLELLGLWSGRVAKVTK